ncbi:MAG: capsular polysaccharide synthesis protein [Roseobacter sp.]
MATQLATMWFDGPLRLVDQVCLASMVETGMPVTLYTYGDVPNAPAGVDLRDGNEILDKALLDRLLPVAKKQQQSWLPTVQFSDFFRVFLQRAGGGLWLDSDVLMFKPFSYDAQDVYFVRERSGGIGASVFYLPPKNPIVAEYERLIETDDLRPDWLEFKRRVLRPLWYRLSGTAFSASDLGITIYGNEAFRQLARRHGITGRAQPPETFYHWSDAQNTDVFKPVPWQFFYDDPAYIGIHIHKKAADDVAKPDPGSLWHAALQRYT